MQKERKSKATNHQSCVKSKYITRLWGENPNKQIQVDRAVMTSFMSGGDGVRGNRGRSTTGRKLDTIGAIVYNADFDYDSKYLRDEYARLQGKSFYERGGKEQHNIFMGDPLVKRKDTNDGGYSVTVFGTCDGLGVKESLNRKFEKIAGSDKHMKNELIKEAILNGLQPAGISGSDFNDIDMDGIDNGLISYVAGLHTIDAHDYFHFGDLAMQVLADPEDEAMWAKTSGHNVRTGTPFLVKPYVPGTIAETAKLHLLGALRDPALYRDVMGEHFDSTKNWLTFAKLQSNSALMTALNFMATVSLYEDNGSGKLKDENNSTKVDDNMAKNILDLAKGFGLIPIQKGEEELLAKYAPLKLNFLRKNFTDGMFDADDLILGENTRIADGRVNVDTAEGAFMNQQINHWVASMSSMEQAFYNKWRWVLGKCVRGADRGDSIDLALGVGKP